jgi:hypothetical protein
MAHRLRCKSILLAAAFLLLAAQRSDAQFPRQPPAPPPGVTSVPKPSQPAPAAKELSGQEVDSLIEKAFGRDCAELKRPIRVWIHDISMVIAAEKASVAKDGSVRFGSASVGLPNDGTDVKALHGDEIVITVDRPVRQEISELRERRVTTVEIHNKNLITTLTPTPNSTFTFVEREKLFEVTTVPPAPAGGPKPGPAPTLVLVDKSFDGMFVGRGMGIRFKFQIDPKAPLAELVPAQPKTSAKVPPWTNEDLAKVPELMFGEPISKKLPKHQAMQTTAHVMAKINHLNAKKTDGFMLAMIDQRTDLRGLPFLMGEECRMREEEAKVFHGVVNAVHQAVRNPQFVTDSVTFFDQALQQTRMNRGRLQHGQFDRAIVAALMQILMPESEKHRIALANYLARVPHAEATKALAKLAIFSAEDGVSAAAINGLKLRREKDYTDILMQGFRYPLPAVSKRAAEALVKLERTDLAPNLVDVLESPDPRLPTTVKREGKDVTMVRELVRVNHHRNCMLCHAPGNTDNTPEGILKVAVPLPGEPLAKPSDGGGYQSTPPPTPDIVVRLDMTYLRQDFSLMMPVSDPHPWPEMQRFDFLVRTRTLTAAEAQAYEPCCEAEEPGRLSPYHRAALFALRELTGRDTEPTAAAWRKQLKLPALQ